MSTALDDVCKALDLRDDSSAIEVMAVRIIELAKTGERSPTRLRDRVLHEAAMADRIGLDYIAPTREVDGEQQTVRVGTMANPSETNHDQVEAALFEAA